MTRLSGSDCLKVKHLVKSNNEISVFGVIDGDLPGEIYVNDAGNPTAVLIQTCECNLVAGAVDDEKFISEISSELDFWDTVTPDSQEWFEKIPLFHENKFIRPFKRNRYILNEGSFIRNEALLPDGFVLEKADPAVLRASAYKNTKRVLEWIEEWGGDSAFTEKGTGFYIRNNEAIVSWSLADCNYSDQITIGVTTDGNYRKQGFGIRAAIETVNDCLMKGYKTINWLCVDSNQGSKRIAEKLGFIRNNDYFYFCSFLPTENLSDISEEQWSAWAEYLEKSSAQEPRLLNECLYSYMKANNVSKVIELIKSLTQYEKTVNIKEFRNDIRYFQSNGLCSKFNSIEWLDFMNSYGQC